MMQQGHNGNMGAQAPATDAKVSLPSFTECRAVLEREIAHLALSGSQGVVGFVRNRLPMFRRVAIAVTYYVLLYVATYSLAVFHSNNCLEPLRRMGWVESMFMASSPLCMALDGWRLWVQTQQCRVLLGPLVAIGLTLATELANSRGGG